MRFVCREHWPDRSPWILLLRCCQPQWNWDLVQLTHLPNPHQEQDGLHLNRNIPKKECYRLERQTGFAQQSNPAATSVKTVLTKHSIVVNVAVGGCEIQLLMDLLEKSTILWNENSLINSSEKKLIDLANFSHSSDCISTKLEIAESAGEGSEGIILIGISTFF